MSPEAILQACGVFDSWRQEGFKQNRPGTLQVFNNTGTLLLDLPLSKRNGLYYCPLASVTGDFHPTHAPVDPALINTVLLHQHLDVVHVSAVTRSQSRAKPPARGESRPPAPLHLPAPRLPTIVEDAAPSALDPPFETSLVPHKVVTPPAQTLPPVAAPPRGHPSFDRRTPGPSPAT